MNKIPVILYQTGFFVDWRIRLFTLRIYCLSYECIGTFFSSMKPDELSLYCHIDGQRSKTSDRTVAFSLKKKVFKFKEQQTFKKKLFWGIFHGYTRNTVELRERCTGKENSDPLQELKRKKMNGVPGLFPALAKSLS